MNNYVITKTEKSQGLGMVLTLLFGPFGLFYATVFGGIMMLFIVPIAETILFVLYEWLMVKDHLNDYNTPNATAVGIGLVIFLISLFVNWIVCLFWSYRAVRNYNYNLHFQNKTQAVEVKENNNSAVIYEIQPFQESASESHEGEALLIMLLIVVMFVGIYYLSKIYLR